MLPIESVFGKIQRTLREQHNAVLVAPPGAGKTTGVPLVLLDADWLKDRKILLLAPRRLAARSAARRMAAQLGQRPGETVGYRTRLDTCIGPRSRLEVITEGVLLRMLQSDPALSDAGLVIFDEFHERSLNADLALAMCMDLQSVLNETLRLLVMSATLAATPVARLMNDAAVIRCEGRSFPVDIIYTGAPPARGIHEMATAVAGCVRKACREQKGSILVFLPGGPEIRRVQGLLEKEGLNETFMIFPLYGMLGRRQQDQAILLPPPGRRKIVLATAIAETSLTIEGIEVVIDAGWMRRPRFDPRSGLTRLETVPVSRASARQRSGRAGRTQPGVCYRLWPAADQNTRPAENRPQILEADLSPLVLELAYWGTDAPEQMKWLDPPPAPAMSRARLLLQMLEALDANGRITKLGRKMVSMPLHPRLARMVCQAEQKKALAMACDLAALLTERDFMRKEGQPTSADLALRMDVLATAHAQSAARIDHGACKRVQRAAEALRRSFSAGKSTQAASFSIGGLLAWAYPDRIAQRRPGQAGRFLLSSGRGAWLHPEDALARSDYLAVAELDGELRDARIFLAAEVDKSELLRLFDDQLDIDEIVAWDADRRIVTAEEQIRLGALVLESKPCRQPDPEKVTAALLQGLRSAGVGELGWTRQLRQWQARVLFLRRVLGADQWPDISDERLEKDLEKWLGAHVLGITKLAALARLDLARILSNRLSWQQRRDLDRMAPTHFTVPSGSSIPIDYSPHPPVLAVRLQEMFGCQQAPVIAGGRQTLQLHLLSPARRPVQITQDLTGFWQNGYESVRRELRGRYPKHFWPQDPVAATATRGVLRRGPSK